MTLAEKLSTYDEKYWDFSEYRNHAPLVRYPAVMVAPMQACILKEIINTDPTTSTVLDPFCGSGTVLCEGKKLGLNVMGFDINPLAVLIATVQLEGIPADCAARSINAINTRLTMLNGNVKPYAFKNINKWFNDDIIVSLSVIALYNEQLHNKSKTIRTWRDTVTQRKLIDTLNQYIHNEQPVDALLLLETWNTMKGYIITCLTVT